MVDDDKEEEVEEEEEKEDQKGDRTFKYIIVLGIGILIGYVIHKFLKERHDGERFIVVNPSVGGNGGMVYDGHRMTPKIDNLTNLLNKNLSGNNVIEVNGMKIEKDTGNLVIDKNPCRYENIIIKRDLVTGEIVDIVTMDQSLIK